MGRGGSRSGSREGGAAGCTTRRAAWLRGCLRALHLSLPPGHPVPTLHRRGTWGSGGGAAYPRQCPFQALCEALWTPRDAGPVEALPQAGAARPGLPAAVWPRASSAAAGTGPLSSRLVLRGTWCSQRTLADGPAGGRSGTWHQLSRPQGPQNSTPTPTPHETWLLVRRRGRRATSSHRRLL